MHLLPQEVMTAESEWDPSKFDSLSPPIGSLPVSAYAPDTMYDDIGNIIFSTEVDPLSETEDNGIQPTGISFSVN